MSYSQVRTFIKQQIALVDSSIKEHRDLSEENIPRTQMESFYMIEYGNISSSHSDNTIQDSFTATVKLYKRGFKKPVDSLDQLLDEANCIRLSIIDGKAVLTENIRDVESVSVFVEPFDVTNDNTLKISLEFNIRLYFATV